MNTVNLIVTIVSILCTIVSIIYSTKATRSAREAEDIKKKLRLTLNTITLKEFVDSYNNAKQLFLKETRNENWYKGKEANIIITPFDETLAKVTLVDSSVCVPEVKERIRELKYAIQEYDKITPKRKKEIIQLMEIIAEDLGAALNQHIGSI